MSNIYIRPIDGILSDATTPGQSGPGNDGNEETLSLSPKLLFAQSAGAVEYTDYSSAEGNPPPTIILDLTLNNLIVSLQ